MLLLQKLLVTIYQNQYLHRQSIIFPKTIQILNILKILTKEGFIYGYKPSTFYDSKYPTVYYIIIYLKYYQQHGVLTFLYNFSRYKFLQKISYKQLLTLKNFSQFLLIHTSKGIMPHLKAIQKHLGGRVVFLII